MAGQDYGPGGCASCSVVLIAMFVIGALSAAGVAGWVL